MTTLDNRTSFPIGSHPLASLTIDPAVTDAAVVVQGTLDITAKNHIAHDIVWYQPREETRIQSNSSTTWRRGSLAQIGPGEQ